MIDFIIIFLVYIISCILAWHSVRVVNFKYGTDVTWLEFFIIFTPLYNIIFLVVMICDSGINIKGQKFLNKFFKM